MNSIILIGIIASIAGGFVLGYIVRRLLATRSVSSAEAKAAQIIHEAKSKEKEILLDAKDKALAVMEAAKRDEEAHRRELSSAQDRLEKRESLFDQRLLDLESKQAVIAEKNAQMDVAREEIQGPKASQLAKLEKVANLTQE